MRILHIAAHVGGGIGSAYIGLKTGGEQHRILLLEKPLDTVTLSRVKEAGFEIIIDADREQIVEELEAADIVVINWTHHPAMTKFLIEFPKIPIRSILWCHVSGNYYPIVPADFVKHFDQVMFATPFSLKLPQFRALGDDYINEHFHVVYGLNDLSRFGKIERKEHDGFRIGYVGTLGFCKLNPDFADYCSAIDITDAKFVMAGNAANQEQIMMRYKQNSGKNEFLFLGQVKDVPAVLSELDVFGYLLNPQHFGATENALLEAMAAGLPVVALEQCVEKYIIKNKETGLLVKSPSEYRQAIRYLYDNPVTVKQTHGDYVQMRCDTGLIGFWLYIFVGIAVMVHCFLICNKPYVPDYIKCCAIITAGALAGCYAAMYSENVVTYTMASTGYPFALYGVMLGMLSKVQPPTFKYKERGFNF